MITAKIPGLPIAKRRLQLLLQFLLNAPLHFHYGLAIFSICFLMGLSSTMYNLLAPTSSDIFKFRLWKLIGAPFVEPNILVFVWSVISLQQFIIYIEPSWGTIEILKYLGIVQLVTTISIAIFGLFLFAAFHALNFFFFVSICGLPVVGICALVSIKQFLPDTVVLTTPYGRLKNGHLPLSALCASLVFWLFGFLRGGVPLQIAVGLQVSWTYLRFFRVSTEILGNTEPTNKEILVIVGDESEHFTWASFFPRRTQPIANIVGNAVFRFLVALKICRRLKDLDLNHIDEALRSTLVAASGALEGRDAERKRQRALRVLNERLSSVAVRTGQDSARLGTSASSSRLPSLLDPSSTRAGPSPVRRDSSTDEAVDVIVKSSSQRDFNQVAGSGMQEPPASHPTSHINEHLYGVASPLMGSISSQEPSKLLARMDSESTTEVNDRINSDSSDDTEGDLR